MPNSVVARSTLIAAVTVAQLMLGGATAFGQPAGSPGPAAAAKVAQHRIPLERPALRPACSRTNSPHASDRPGRVCRQTAFNVTVTSVADSGPGSLRAAMTAANAAAGTSQYTIGFDITTGCEPDGACVIAPATPLPPITRGNVMLTGFGQPGPGSTVAQPNGNATLSAGDDALLYVEIDGTNYDAPGKSGLVLDAGNVTVEGIAFVNTNFDNVRWETGVLVNAGGANAVIQGDYFGFGTDGFLGAELNGVTVSGANGVMIGGNSPAAENIFSDNVDGIRVCSAAGLAVERNILGPAPDGHTSVDDVYAQNFSNLLGVAVDDHVSATDRCPSGSAPSSSINLGGTGGTPLAAGGTGNLISDDGTGILLDGSAATAQNNFVGTDGKGLGSLPNGTGLQDSGAADVIQNNVVSGNDAAMEITGSGSRVLGNLVGLNASGKVMADNFQSGITIGCLGSGTCPTLPAGVTIGAPAEANKIEYNQSGLDVSACASCTVQANRISNNDSPGIRVEHAPQVLVGGTASGDGNVIVANNGGGIVLDALTPATHVAIHRNTIWNNPFSGLKLSPSDIVVGTQGLNCAAPVANIHAPNDNIPCPRIRWETLQSTGSNTVTSISGSAATGASVEVFVASNDPGESGAGGAIRYLGTASASSGSCVPSPCPSGSAGWTLHSPFLGGYALNRGQPVTSTATLPVPGSPSESDTSQFSPNFADLSAGGTTVTTTRDMFVPGLPCDTSTLGGFVGNTAMTLRCAISEANLFPAQTVTFALPSSDPNCTAQIIHTVSATVCTFRSAATLPMLIGKGLTIDGFNSSPGGARANTNAFGQPDNSIHTIQLRTGLLVGGINETIRGLDLAGISTTGLGQVVAAISFVGLPSKGTKVYGDYFGLDPDGVTADHNGAAIGAQAVLGSVGGTTDAVIGSASPANRNVIDDTLQLGGDTGDVVAGNYIGTNAPGTGALTAPDTFGVEAGGINLVIGTAAAGGGNVISGWPAVGIDLGAETGGAGAGITVQHNLVGTNLSGTAAIGNGNGISNVFGPFASHANITDNLVSGNELAGIVSEGAPSVSNPAFPYVSITGNRVGVSSTGAALPNGGAGILVGGMQDPFGSDILPGRLNLIAGNIVQSNKGAGIEIGVGATDNTQAVLSRNTVNHNVKAGIVLTGQSSCGSGYSPGSAPNDFTPCPTGLHLGGPASNATLTGSTCPGCLVEVFVASSGTGDGTHGGSGQFLGSVTAGTCAAAPCSGNSTAFSLGGLTIPSGAKLTATATQQTAGSTPVPLETSAFSPNVALTP